MGLTREKGKTENGTCHWEGPAQAGMPGHTREGGAVCYSRKSGTAASSTEPELVFLDTETGDTAME